MVRLASAPQLKPLVVRVDEVGRAEAVAYEAMEAWADPLDPTTGLVVDHYSRRRGTVREYWERFRGFLTPQVLRRAGRGCLGAHPPEAYSAGGTFDLVRVRGGEVNSSNFSVLNFVCTT